MKNFLLIFTVLLSFVGTAQKIELNKNKYFINGEQIPTYEIKQKMKDTDYTAYANFRTYNNKTSFGGFFIGFGGALIVADVVVGLVSNVKYPTAMTYIGAASLIASYPILKGRTKKLNKAIETYNEAVTNKTETSENTEFGVNAVANSRGIGLQINF